MLEPWLTMRNCPVDSYGQEWRKHTLQQCDPWGAANPARLSLASKHRVAVYWK
ncbi:MAG: hypothetical protein ACYDGY_10400 [Acidimicrobiales bacterium]